jgi:hypothetical protein
MLLGGGLGASDDLSVLSADQASFLLYFDHVTARTECNLFAQANSLQSIHGSRTWLRQLFLCSRSASPGPLPRMTPLWDW